MRTSSCPEATQLSNCQRSTRLPIVPVRTSLPVLVQFKVWSRRKRGIRLNLKSEYCGSLTHEGLVNGKEMMPGRNIHRSTVYNHLQMVVRPIVCILCASQNGGTTYLVYLHTGRRPNFPASHPNTNATTWFVVRTAILQHQKKKPWHAAVWQGRRPRNDKASYPDGGDLVLCYKAKRPRHQHRLVRACPRKRFLNLAPPRLA